LNKLSKINIGSSSIEVDLIKTMQSFGKCDVRQTTSPDHDLNDENLK